MTQTEKSRDDELLKAALAAAEAARGVTLSFFRSPEIVAENKRTAGFDPVTQADRAAEEAMRACLMRLRPGDGILGEEFGPTAGTSGLTWVLDPIDGTRGFMSGTPTWGTLIAVRDADGPILGLIDQPYTDECFIGGPGIAELRHRGRTVPLATRPRLALQDAILFTTFPEVGTEAERAAFRRVAERVLLTRYGMDCYAYALVAAGQIDLVIEAGLAPYDVQAPIAVVKAAGGIVTNWTGGPAHDGGQIIAAGSPQIHAAALALLAGQAGPG